VKHLKQHSWNVDQAVNDYFNIRPASVTSTASKGSLNKIFDKYQKKPGEPDTIEVNGTMIYFQELSAGEGIDQFIVSELLQCPTFGEITRDGFTKGWGELGVDTLDRQKKIIAARRASVASDPNLKKNVYSYAFKLGLQPMNQRSVPKEYAIEFWKVLLAPPMVNWKTKSRDWLADWLEFVDKSNTKGVNKDVWEQTIKFAEETLKDESLKWWDETSAWPALIDEFVEWIREKYGNPVNEDEEMIY
jgi:DCN1-like protein 1/2